MYKYYEIFKLNKRYIIMTMIAIISLIEVTFYQLLRTFPEYKKNIIDLILFVISDVHIVLYLFTLLFIIAILYLSKKGIFNEYVLLRYNNKIRWYKTQLITLFLYSFLFVLFVVCICFIISVSNLQLVNTWSDFAKYISKSYNPIITKDMVQNYSPNLLIIINSVYLLLYLNMSGLIYFISNLLTKNNIIGFIISYSSIILSLSIEYLNIINLIKFIPFKNIIISEHNLDYINNHNPSFLFSFLYFLIINFLLIITGYIILQKKEIKLDGGKS